MVKNPTIVYLIDGTSVTVPWECWSRTKQRGEFFCFYRAYPAETKEVTRRKWYRLKPTTETVVIEPEREYITFMFKIKNVLWVDYGKNREELPEGQADADA